MSTTDPAVEALAEALHDAKADCGLLCNQAADDSLSEAFRVDSARLSRQIHSLTAKDILAAMPDWTLVRREELERLRAALDAEHRLTGRHHRLLRTTRLYCSQCWNSDHAARAKPMSLLARLLHRRPPATTHGTCAICRTDAALVVRRLCLPCAAELQRMGYGECLEEQARIDRRLAEIGR